MGDTEEAQGKNYNRIWNVMHLEFFLSVKSLSRAEIVNQKLKLLIKSRASCDVIETDGCGIKM